MRTFQEIEHRLLFVLANSFRGPTFLNWDKVEGNRAWINLDSTGSNFYLFVLNSRGSGLIRLDGKPYFELDRYHFSIPIPQGRHMVELELSNLMDFGERTEISHGTPVITERDLNAYRLWIYGSTLLEEARALNDGEFTGDVLNLLSEALKLSPFSSVSREQIILAVNVGMRGLGLERAHQIIEEDLVPIFREDEDRAKFEKALNRLKSGLEELRRKYGKRGRLIGVGHAHIDTAWLWNFDETRRKVLRTFSTVLTLMGRYDFHQVQSMSIYYEWIKEDAPELFERIKQRVREGRWELGAAYVETDANVVSGESLARQMLYSQRFYLQNFGKLAEILWLPDTFGFNANLPQIARLGGVKAFATHKVFWNDTNTFPYNVFNWVGPDGRPIPAVAFGHGKGGYNSDFSADSVLEQWRNWKEKDQPMLYAYGYGDGGGGPTEEMLLRTEAVNASPILPKVSLGGVSEVLSEIRPLEEWRGELYLETHRGVLTSHSKMKLLNRRSEIALREAELWASLAGKYDGAKFQSMWKVLLKDQFHDVLPGSAIRDVYRVVYPELELLIKEAYDEARRAAGSIAGEGEAILAFNSLPWEREDYLVSPWKVEGGQEVEGGTLVRIRVPPVGYAEVKPIQSGVVQVSEGAGGITMDNGLIRVVISREGELISLVDLTTNRELLTSPSGITAYENAPGWADAWDIEPGYAETSFPVRAVKVEVTKRGPLMASVSVERRFRNSIILQEVIVAAGSKRLDFRTTLRVRDRELMFKAWFHFDVNAHSSVSDVPFGIVERPTHSNTSWDKARFEVPIQKFVYLDEWNYGVALINDGKYGASIRGSSVGLTLSRTPIFPDPSTDLEEVTFTYSLLPCSSVEEALRAAYELNVPVLPIRGKPGEKALLKVQGRGLMLETVKGAEEGRGLILRFYEFMNSRGEATVEFPFEVGKVSSLDLLEINEIPREIQVYGNRVKFSYRNREVITLRVERAS